MVIYKDFSTEMNGVNNVIRAIESMPLDNLDSNAKRRVIAESRKYYWHATYPYSDQWGIMSRVLRLQDHNCCYYAKHVRDHVNE